jgi:hypothetical protein
MTNVSGEIEPPGVIVARTSSASDRTLATEPSHWWRTPGTLPHKAIADHVAGASVYRGDARKGAAQAACYGPVDLELNVGRQRLPRLGERDREDARGVPGRLF